MLINSGLRYLKVITVIYVLCVVCSAYGYEVQQGTLFTTPEQRDALESIRDQHKRGLYKVNQDVEVQTGYKFNGLVIKEGDSQRIWLNGSAGKQKTKRDKKGLYLIAFPEGQQKRLKPGQVYFPSTNEVLEEFEGELQ